MEQLKERFLYLSGRMREVTDFYTTNLTGFATTQEEVERDSELVIKSVEGINQLSGAMAIIINSELTKSNLDALEMVLATHEAVVMGYTTEEVEEEPAE